MKINYYYIAPIAVFAVIVIMALGLERKNPDVLPSMAIGKQAPALTLSAFGNEPILTSDDLSEKGVKLVNFWASWCGPCRAEHPNLVALAQTGLKIHGINHKDRLVDAQRFINSLGNPYTKMGRDEGRTGIDWGVTGMPETFVLDGNGKVVLRHAGPITQRALKDTILPAIEAARALSP